MFHEKKPKEIIFKTFYNNQSLSYLILEFEIQIRAPVTLKFLYLKKQAYQYQYS